MSYRALTVSGVVFREQKKVLYAHYAGHRGAWLWYGAKKMTPTKGQILGVYPHYLLLGVYVQTEDPFGHRKTVFRKDTILWNDVVAGLIRLAWTSDSLNEADDVEEGIIL